MTTERLVRSTCELCRHGCGVLVHVEDGKVTRIEGDPDSPFNKGKLCDKGLASLEYVYSPDRLKYPLKRVGERGEGKWQQITWDEALNAIAEALIKAKDNYGAESVIGIRSAARGINDDYFARFFNVFGTPNATSTGYVCHLPMAGAFRITYGFDSPLSPDYDYPPACILVWGADVKATAPLEYESTIQALDKGSKLIIVDPRQIDLATRADIWMQVRPGSDLALALGMINVIVNEGLFDKAFVDNWTVGFDELKAHVQDYPPEKVADITWVKAETIREAARLYATNKPACIQQGNGLETNTNSFQACRAMAILRAITGNLGIPGGDLYTAWSAANISRGSPRLTLADKVPEDMRNMRISAKDGLLPMLRYALPQTIVKSILEGDPYPIRVAYLQGANLLLTWANAQETYRALNRLEFLAVADMFMTPTAALADVVLPVVTYLEFDGIFSAPLQSVPRVQQKIAEVGECWSDYKILGELAKKLGLGEYFWDDEEEFRDFIMKPIGITFKELKKMPLIPKVFGYRNYEAEGFKTPSGKIELYSNQLKEWGFDPLPIYYELPETPYSAPGLAKEYPLVFTSGKSAFYRHSAGRQIPSLRDSHPEPIIGIHPETASRLGLKEGDRAYIETKRGRITQKVSLITGIDPRVVYVDYAWWFPESGVTNLYDWVKSNVNILTDNKLLNGREMGSANLRGILCKVYKAP